MSNTSRLSGEVAQQQESNVRVDEERLVRAEKAAGLMGSLTIDELVAKALDEFFQNHSDQLTYAQHLRHQQEEIQANRLQSTD